MNKVNEYIDSFSFKDEIAKATQIKSELQNGIENVGLNMFDFAEDIEQNPANEVLDIPRDTIPFQEPKEHEEPYDAEANASSLVYTLTAIDSIVLSIAGQLKCRSAAGGGKTLKKMKAVLGKELSGKELTEHELLLKAKFEEYKSNIKLLSGEIIPAQSEIERLIASAIPYCEETKLKVGAGSAFWLSYIGNLAQRATKIAMT